MTENVSRRNFVALAGAGAVVAACSPEMKNAAATESAKVDFAGFNIDAFLKSAGLEAYGDPANFDKNNPPEADRSYAPPFILIAHLQSKAPWHFSSNHAHFEVSKFLNEGEQNDPKSRLRIALDILAHKLENNLDRFKDTQDTDEKKYMPYDRGSGVLADEISFQKLGFRNQHDIYVFFESRDVGLIDGNILYFKKKLSDGTDAKPNHAFKNARILNDDMIGPQSVVAKKGRMILIENHVKDSSGNSLSNKPQHRYSMNFVYLAPDPNNETVLPMIIDPDTGNGMGNNP